jgi:hypothetical protein
MAIVALALVGTARSENGRAAQEQTEAVLCSPVARPTADPVVSGNRCDEAGAGPREKLSVIPGGQQGHLFPLPGPLVVGSGQSHFSGLATQAG